jgi:hypothetical protein
MDMGVGVTVPSASTTVLQQKKARVKTPKTFVTLIFHTSYLWGKEIRNETLIQLSTTYTIDFQVRSNPPQKDLKKNHRPASAFQPATTRYHHCTLHR